MTFDLDLDPFRHDAGQFCQMIGGHLLAVETAEEMQFIVSLLMAAGKINIDEWMHEWINDLMSECVGKWVN